MVYNKEHSDINVKLFNKLLKRYNINLTKISIELGIHRQTIWNWKINNKFPKFLEYYFHNYELELENNKMTDILSTYTKKLEYYKNNLPEHFLALSDKHTFNFKK